MPKVSEMIESKFLRKEDLEDDTSATIAGVSLQDMPGDGHEQRWTVEFRELKKAMVLNTTTIRVLEKSFGDNSDQWIGKKVILYVDPNVSFKGQIVGGIRLRPAKPAVAASKRKGPPPPVADAEDFNDEIPH